MRTITVDFVVIGCGLAGSAVACGLRRLGDVAILSKGSVSETNSYHAQGGIAAAVSADDHPNSHFEDTLNAGAGLCHDAHVRRLVEEAPALMSWLSQIGVPFDHDKDGALKLGLEGAHRRRRILHAGGDATGRKVMEVFRDRLDRCSNVELFSSTTVYCLVKDTWGRVVGVLGSDTASKMKTLWLARKAVILATGGLGNLFKYTSNPPHATGDGVALAFQVGAEIRNMEFVQFHPTVFASKNAPRFLISEAVRGAGARLVDGEGRTIFDRDHKNLGPRDVVARAIYRHMRTQGEVYLDTTVVQGFSDHFPTIYEACREAGFHPAHEPIPVTPAAHFVMGGIATDFSGKTSIPGLFALGEAAHTGVHGANRLASNSLLECLTMAFACVRHFEQNSLLIVDEFLIEDLPRTGFRSSPAARLATVQTILWDSCGIEREDKGLRQGLKKLYALHETYVDDASVLVALLIAHSARSRKESRGAHYRLDYPFTNDRLEMDSIVSKSSFEQAKARAYA